MWWKNVESEVEAEMIRVYLQKNIYLQDSAAHITQLSSKENERASQFGHLQSIDFRIDPALEKWGNWGEDWVGVIVTLKRIIWVAVGILGSNTNDALSEWRRRDA